MNLLIVSLAVWTFNTSTLLGLLLWVAIAAIVIWAIVMLVRWSGIPIPEPVRIIFIALVSILLIVLLFHAFGLLM